MGFPHICMDAMTNDQVSAAANSVMAFMAVVAWLTTLVGWYRTNEKLNKAKDEILTLRLSPNRQPSAGTAPQFEETGRTPPAGG